MEKGRMPVTDGIHEISEAIGRLRGDVKSVIHSVDALRTDVQNGQEAFNSFKVRATQEHERITSDLGTLNTNIEVHKAKPDAHHHEEMEGQGWMRERLAKYRTEVVVSALVVVALFIERLFK